MAIGSPSFSEAYPDLVRLAYRAAWRVTGDSAAAEDVAAEALTRALLRWNRVGSHARPWVVRVATNLAIDQARRRTVRQRHVARDRSDDAAVEVDGHVDLHRALAALPRRQRQVVVLRYFGDLSEREIADELGLAPGTVKSHASRGLDALRRVLAPSSEATTPRPEVLP